MSVMLCQMKKGFLGGSPVPILQIAQNWLGFFYDGVMLLCTVPSISMQSTCKLDPVPLPSVLFSFLPSEEEECFILQATSQNPTSVSSLLVPTMLLSNSHPRGRRGKERKEA